MPSVGRGNAYYRHNSPLVDAPLWRKVGEPLGSGLLGFTLLYGWLSLRSWSQGTALIAGLLVALLAASVKGAWACGIHVFASATAPDERSRVRARRASIGFLVIWVLAGLVVFALSLGQQP